MLRNPFSNLSKKEKSKPELPRLISKGTIQPQLGHLYTLVEVEGPCYFCGFLDLSALQPGDIIEIMQRVQLDGSDGMKVLFHRSYPLDPRFRDKLVYFDRLFVPVKMDIQLRCTAGFPRILYYNWYKEV